MWLILILAYIFVGFILSRIALKRTLNRIKTLPSSKIITLLCWQFIFCLIFSISVFAILKGLGAEKPIIQFNYLWLIVIVIGVLNSYAAFCSWLAIDISLSKTSIGTQLDDAISIVIGYIFLGEAKFFGPLLFFGIVLCFLAAFILVGFNKSSQDLKNWQLIKNILKYSVIWGIAFASVRYFNLNGLPLSEFLVCWYGSSTLGMLLIFFSRKIAGKETIGLRLNSEDKKEIPILAVFIWGSMLIEYSVAHYALIAIYQPILLVSEAILPTLLGLYYFHEHKEMKTKEWAAIAIGVAGSIMVGMSY